MPKRLLRAGLLIGALAPFIASGDVAEDYTRKIRPIIDRHCIECHGPDNSKADLNLAVFEDYDSVTASPEIWQVVLERVQAFEMPPGARELPFQQQQDFVNWLRALPKPEATDCTQIASDRTASFYRGYVMGRRLNRAEYLNTLRDLFGMEMPVGDLLPEDGGGGEGFDTAGNALFLSPIHIERYLDAAEKALRLALPDATSPTCEALARSDALRMEWPTVEVPARDAARRVLATFGRRAFRRPLSEEEVNRWLLLFDRGWERGDGYVPSIRLALQGMLVSPHFLFLAEPEPDVGGVQPLAPVPLASKLSYFLWSSMPDEQLLALAESGALLDTNVYRSEIHRMLADPRARALGERFALQWLDVARLGDEIHPDPVQFPEFTDDLAASMREELITFFVNLFQEGRSLLELIDSDYIFANEHLAALYGLEGVSGAEWRKVPLPRRTRGGVLGMAAVHALTSYPLRTSPVLRGRWVLESLLGEKIPPPPPDVPSLEETGSGEQLTLRQQLEMHRAKAECAACHDKMDPLGFGLENFDPLGRWRETDRDQPVDARGVLPSGETYEGPEGLKEVLLGRKDQIIRHLARKLTGFALGRDLNKFDNCLIDRAMEALQAADYRAPVLVESIALSFPFRHRFYPKQNP